jgi:ligand-binding sensor domain-containing protein
MSVMWPSEQRFIKRSLSRVAAIGRGPRPAAALIAALTLIAAPRVMAVHPATILAEFSVTNWTENDGPFPFGIYAIAQDHDGYLWLGTRTGLVRFDRLNFSIWNERVRLPESRVSAICVSKDASADRCLVK